MNLRGTLWGFLFSFLNKRKNKENKDHNSNNNEEKKKKTKNTVQPCVRAATPGVREFTGLFRLQGKERNKQNVRNCTKQNIYFDIKTDGRNG